MQLELKKTFVLVPIYAATNICAHVKHGTFIRSHRCEKVPHIQLSQLQGRPSTGSIANGYTYVQLNPMDIQWLLLKSKQVDSGRW